jgi:hypothetical protein
MMRHHDEGVGVAGVENIRIFLAVDIDKPSNRQLRSCVDELL